MAHNFSVGRPHLHRLHPRHPLSSFWAPALQPTRARLRDYQSGHQSPVESVEGVPRDVGVEVVLGLEIWIRSLGF